MNSGLMLILRGLLVFAAFIGVTTAFFRVIGLSRGEALYLACLSFAIAAYLLSRFALQHHNRD